MKQDELWTIASVMETRYRDSSFGGRASSSSDIHNVCWDPSAEAFVRGDLHGFGCGNSWRWGSYPCRKELALAILTLCATEEVQKRFFKNSYSETEDREIYCCEDSLVSFKRSAAYRDGSRYILLASFSFQFYSPDGRVQTLGLGYELTQRFAERIKSFDTETLPQALDKIRASA